MLFVDHHVSLCTLKTAGVLSPETTNPIFSNRILWMIYRARSRLLGMCPLVCSDCFLAVPYLQVLRWEHISTQSPENVLNEISDRISMSFLHNLSSEYSMNLYVEPEIAAVCRLDSEYWECRRVVSMAVAVKLLFHEDMLRAWDLRLDWKWIFENILRFRLILLTRTLPFPGDSFRIRSNHWIRCNRRSYLHMYIDL